MTNNFAQRLEVFRAKSGLSQNGLSNKSGVAAAQISRYEAGKSVPTSPIIQRLADALGVSYTVLAHGKAEKAHNIIISNAIINYNLEISGGGQEFNKERKIIVTGISADDLSNNLDLLESKVEEDISNYFNKEYLKEHSDSIAPDSSISIRITIIDIKNIDSNIEFKARGR